MHIAIIGSGYVGLVSGACFAEFGVNVTCVDQDHAKISKLKQGQMPIFEPGLSQLVERNVQKKYLSFTTDLASAVCDAQIVFIAVGTPSRRGDGHADLSYVYTAAEQIAPHLSDGVVIATKSTVPVGTGRNIQKIIQQHAPNLQFDMVSNPEFLREGSAIEDFMRPDRVVVGCDSEHAATAMKQLYRPLYLRETPLVITSLQTAELSKYASNAFLATKIAFINQISDLCEQCDADVHDVAKAMGLDKRIGSKFLHAGPGYGGSCFPKDTMAMIKTAQDFNTPVTIVEAVAQSNTQRKQNMALKIIQACGGTVKDKKIAILGLTFKPNTDDMRDSASLDIIAALQSQGALITAFDPQGMEEAKKFLNDDVIYVDDPYQAMNQADAMVIVTEWNEFRALDLERIKMALKSPIVVDFRNIYVGADMKACGFEYTSIGRSTQDFQKQSKDTHRHVPLSSDTTLRH